MLKTGFTLFALLLAFDVASVKSCVTKEADRSAANENRNVNGAPPPERAENQKMEGDFKVLVSGNHSSVEQPFVVVARDAETYRELRALETNLPEQTADFFKTNAVVAAFLGERRTGGYGINVRRAEGGGVLVTASSPAKDGIVTQVLTSPSKIVVVPVADSGRLDVNADEAFTTGMRLFKVTSGDFTMSGGVAGRSLQFGLGGTVRIGQLGKVVSVAFALRGADEGKARELKAIASEIASDVLPVTKTSAAGEQKGFVLAKLDAGSLVDYPRSPLRATVQFVGNDRLTISFQSQPSNLADGFTGIGSLEAVAASNPPAAPKGRSEQ